MEYGEPTAPDEGGISAAVAPAAPDSLSLQPDEAEQKEIVKTAIAFKKSVMAHSKDRKAEMRRCLAYIKSKLQDGDLLPRPSSEGSDRDANTDRPQVFMPLSRQQYKQLKSQIRLTIFPNDEDFFRVRAKTNDPIGPMPQPIFDPMTGLEIPQPPPPKYTDFEDPLTEGLKYVFKEAHISEKIGQNLDNSIWAGCFAGFPTIQDRTIPEWELDMSIPGYVKVAEHSVSTLDVEVFNPIDFYIDPSAKDPEYAKWVYVGRKKCQEIKDSRVYFNKDKLKLYAGKTVNFSNKEDGLSIHDIHGLNSSFDDSEENLEYDLFYFPYLKTSASEYRNMIVGVAGGECLVRFHPNTTPRGMNPVVFTGWDTECENPYPQGPIEDMKDIQRNINFMANYKVETLARMGNRFAASADVEIENAFGIAGGIIITPEGQDVRQNVMSLTGDYSEIAAITNDIGVLKAEAQIVSGAQNPFQGASNIDFKKTATEINRLTENSISILREVIEHLCNMGVSRLLERCMYLVPDLYPEPITIPVDRPFGGREFIQVDFSLLKSGQYVVELVNINPSQSKQVQTDGLMKLMELFMGAESPAALQIMEPLIVKIGELMGIKNIRDILDQIKQRMNALAAPVAPVPGTPASVGVDPNQSVEGIPQAPIDDQGIPAA